MCLSVATRRALHIVTVLSLKDDELHLLSLMLKSQVSMVSVVSASCDLKPW